MTCTRLNGVTPAEGLLGIKILDRGHNILSILRRPKFIEYFNHIDQAPDGIKIKSSLFDDQYVQIKLTRFGEQSRFFGGLRCHSNS